MDFDATITRIAEVAYASGAVKMQTNIALWLLANGASPELADDVLRLPVPAAPAGYAATEEPKP